MTGTPEILVLGDRARSEGLLRGLGHRDRVLCRREPYEALEAMSGRRWRTVVLATPQADFGGLCRAARRLQRRARIFALCEAMDEPDVRPLQGKALDDYFIFPPTQADLRQLAGSDASARPSEGGGAAARQAMTAGQLAQLVEAAGSFSSLEDAVVALFAAHGGAAAEWVDAEQITPGVQPLLLAQADRPRALLAEFPGKGASPEALALAATVDECLPALLATARRTESLHRLAITDHLTDTYNRRYFYHLTDHILRQAGEKNFRATLLLYDIDDFKHYNDTYGYAAGDEILRATAMLMKQTTRSHDVVARIGGDEFAVLFWDAEEPRTAGSRPPETAEVLADRFRKAVAGHRFASLGAEATGVLTISGGLASFPRHGRTCRELLRKADEAIKAAKASGKDGIQLVG